MELADSSCATNTHHHSSGQMTDDHKLYSTFRTIEYKKSVVIRRIRRTLVVLKKLVVTAFDPSCMAISGESCVGLKMRNIVFSHNPEQQQQQQQPC